MNAPKHPLIVDPSQQIPNKAFRSRWERQLGQTESPIEARFLEAFCEAALEAGYLIGPNPKVRDGGYQETIGVKPQKVLDRYRLDFEITFVFEFGFILIAVETDGQAFHDRTPEQSDRDRERDRAVQQLGYEVMRFSGRAIFADAKACAMEVLNRIQDFQHEQFVANAFKPAGMTG